MEGDGAGCDCQVPVQRGWLDLQILHRPQGWRVRSPLERRGEGGHVTIHPKEEGSSITNSALLALMYMPSTSNGPIPDL